MLGKRTTCNMVAPSLDTDSRTDVISDMYKKQRAAEREEDGRFVGEPGGKEATGVGATGELAGANESARQEE